MRVIGWMVNPFVFVSKKTNKLLIPCKQLRCIAYAISFFLFSSVFANASIVKSLKLYFVHTGEKEEIIFKRNGHYDPKGLKKVNILLRDWRRNRPTRMDPALLDLLWEAYERSGSRAYIHVVSGYRSPETNALLRSQSLGVAKNSQHMLGKAIDFYFPDVPVKKIRNIGLKMQKGGVGYYPRAGSPFIHLDVGNVRHWPSISRSELVAMFPTGKTLHVPKDGKPLPGYEEAMAAYQSRKKTQEVMVAQENTKSHETKKKSSGFALIAALFGGKKSKQSRSQNAPVSSPAYVDTYVEQQDKNFEEFPVQIAQSDTKLLPSLAPVPSESPYQEPVVQVAYKKEKDLFDQIALLSEKDVSHPLPVPNPHSAFDFEKEKSSVSLPGDTNVATLISQIPLPIPAVRFNEPSTNPKDADSDSFPILAFSSETSALETQYSIIPTIRPHTSADDIPTKASAKLPEKEVEKQPQEILTTSETSYPQPVESSTDFEVNDTVSSFALDGKSERIHKIAYHNKKPKPHVRSISFSPLIVDKKSIVSTSVLSSPSFSFHTMLGFPSLKVYASGFKKTSSVHSDVHRFKGKSVQFFSLVNFDSFPE